MMENEILTFGEFLRSLLNEKNISVTKLAELTEMKSRNAIQRIFNDSTSMKVVEDFASKLSNVVSLELSLYELEKLNQAVEVSRSSKEKYIARQKLLEIINTDHIGINQTEYISEKQKEKLHAVFSSYQEYKKIEIIIFGNSVADYIDELLLLIKTIPNIISTIRHCINFGNNSAENATVFSAIFKLLNYDFYNPVYYSSNNHISDLVVIKKVDSKNKCSTDLLTLYQNKLFFLENQNGDKLYCFYSNYFDAINKDSPLIKNRFSNNGDIDDLIKLCEWFAEREESSNEYEIKQNMCYCMMPFEILYNVFSENDFLGLGEKDPQIQKIIQIIYTRFQNYYNGHKLKTNILTKRGLLDFVESGYLSDHVAFCRAFNRIEIKAILEFILTQLEINPYYKLYLLKNDYSIGNIEFLYFEDQYLYMLESSSGYGEDYFEAIINAKPVLEIFDDFVKYELLVNHVYPESETIDYIKHLISTLD